MTFTATNRTGISRQRGFRLRCFLGLTLAAFCMGAIAHAQLDMPKPFRVSHFEGLVMSPYGKPVENADISLTQNGRAVFSTRTDVAGHFKLDDVAGQFVFRVKTPDYSVVAREVVIGFELATAIHGNRLYVILGPGACSDDCSSVFTRKGDFEKAMRKLARHSRK
jgi:hypothetical protein